MYQRAIEALNSWLQPLVHKSRYDNSEPSDDEHQQNHSKSGSEKSLWSSSEPKVVQEQMTVSESPQAQSHGEQNEPDSHKRHYFNSEPLFRKPRYNYSEPSLKKSRIRNSEPKNYKHRNVGSGSFKGKLNNLPLEDLIREIRLARDKAYDGDPLTPFQEFLFEQFQRSTDPVETIAKRLKARLRR